MNAIVTPVLKMGHAGREWLRKQLAYCQPGREPSAFGESVADLLGLCWAGLYHLENKAILRAEWEHDHYIRISIGRTDLATWDYNTLTQLVVVGHDMGIRIDVVPWGLSRIGLTFSPRERGAYEWSDRERCQASQHPTLESHVEKIRAMYEVVDREVAK